MRIGELSIASGLSVDTLRYYERQGLIDSPAREANGYRNYSNETLGHLHLLTQAKAVGFTLSECRQLLAIFQSRDAHTCGEVKQLAELKLEEIEQQIARLKLMSATLHSISDACCGGEESATSCTILENLSAAVETNSQESLT